MAVQDDDTRQYDDKTHSQTILILRLKVRLLPLQLYPGLQLTYPIICIQPGTSTQRNQIGMTVRMYLL